MDNILLEATDNSPKVIMDKDKGLIEFEGKSYPENTFAFYRPITEWLKGYLLAYSDESANVCINFKFLYFNSATTQIIFEILDIVAESKVKEIKIYWYYDQESQSGFEDYEDYSEEFPELNIEAVTYVS
ncbi:MAG: Unknown protein [uncultured Sulfurovum sp.]|uniref:SiaC family regulatory phosphoprotein domain-containing protein n=1 Tax=uncultured Sulfurovum sp. TaxID=269237 RepID=A0A6S6TD88_9BACT|nr:MAG: Unknown protein [uncultured Sulfurovum sp.]